MDCLPVCRWSQLEDEWSTFGNGNQKVYGPFPKDFAYSYRSVFVENVFIIDLYKLLELEGVRVSTTSLQPVKMYSIYIPPPPHISCTVKQFLFSGTPKVWTLKHHFKLSLSSTNTNIALVHQPFSHQSFQIMTLSWERHRVERRWGWAKSIGRRACISLPCSWCIRMRWGWGACG